MNIGGFLSEEGWTQKPIGFIMVVTFQSHAVLYWILVNVGSMCFDKYLRGFVSEVGLWSNLFDVEKGHKKSEF